MATSAVHDEVDVDKPVPGRFPDPSSSSM
ncbi:hypothetical protein LINGRAHAP2_LOCUS9042 [Linum grandiflorum]